MSYKEALMRTETGLLMTGWGILMIAAGCSQLQNDLPATVEALNTEVCETCHPLRPQTENHYIHMYADSMEKPLPLKCQDCHRGFIDSIGWVEPSFHRNGRIDTSDAECEYCHNYRMTCNDATFCHSSPPAANETEVKVHKHVTEQDMKCNVCHDGYDLEEKIIPRDMHDNGQIDVVFNVPQKTGRPTIPVFDNGSCYNLYCHGAVTPGGKQVVSISDVEPTGPQKCDFCHNTDMLYLLVEGHHVEGHAPANFKDCLTCHPGFSYNLQTEDKAKHRNDTLDITSKAECNANCHKVPIP